MQPSFQRGADEKTTKDGPVAIFDVADDPRIQYPEAAKKEGIASLVSVPVVSGGRIIGALRLYTAEPWEFTLENLNFIQAMANITGMARHLRGMKESIEILKTLRDPKILKSRRRTPFEGVPRSVSMAH